MNEAQVISMIFAKGVFEILKVLPRSRSKAITTVQLAELLDQFPSTMYRNFEPLLQWNNLGSFNTESLGPPLWHFYLKNDFSITFKHNNIKITYE